MLTVHCPKCAQALHIDEQHLGTRGRCLKCAEPIVAERHLSSGAIGVLTLTEYLARQAVSASEKAARSEWTPFELPGQPSIADHTMEDTKDIPAAASSAEQAPEETRAPGVAGPLAGLPTAPPSDEVPTAFAGGEEAGNTADVEAADDPFSEAKPAADETDDSATVEAEGEGETNVQPEAGERVSKSGFPPLPGLPGMAAFPPASETANAAGAEENVASMPEAKANADSDSDTETEAPVDAAADPASHAHAEESGDDPKFSASIEAGSSSAAPWATATSAVGESKVSDEAGTEVEAEDAPVEETSAIKPLVGLPESMTTEEAAPDLEASVENEGEETAGDVSSSLEGSDFMSRFAASTSAAEASAEAAVVDPVAPQEGSEDAESEVGVEAEAEAEADASSELAGTEIPAEASEEEDDDTPPWLVGKTPSVGVALSKPAVADPPAPEAKPEPPKESKAPKAPEPEEESHSPGGADPTIAKVATQNRVRDKRKRKKRRRRVAALFFLMLLAGGVAAGMYYKPSLRPESLAQGFSAAFTEGKSQFDAGEGFNVAAIVAPLKALWTADAAAPQATGVAATDGDAQPGGETPAADAGSDAATAATGGGDAVRTPPSAGATVAATGAGAAVADAPPADAGEETIETRPIPGEDDETKRVRLAGEEVIKAFYAARSAEEKLALVHDANVVGTEVEEAYPSPVDAPTMKTIAFKGRLVDSGTQRVFGVFDVQENENGDRHRWCVPEVASGEFKIDWGLYRQLAEDELTRFLANPDAETAELRLLLRRGPEVAPEDRPWNETTYEMHVLMPLDDGRPSTLMMTKASHDALGLADGLGEGVARVGLVQVGWVPAGEGDEKVATIVGLERWGAWAD